MNYVDATVLVSAAQADIFRKVSAQLGQDTDGMFTTAVRLKNSTAISDYVSSGPMPSAYLDALQTPAKLKAEFDKKWDSDAVKKSKKFTLAEISLAHAALTQHTGNRWVLVEGVSVNTNEGFFALLERLGKELVPGEPL